MDGYITFAETLSRSLPGGFVLWYLDIEGIFILWLNSKQILPDCFKGALNLVKWILSVAQENKRERK